VNPELAFIKQIPSILKVTKHTMQIYLSKAEYEFNLNGNTLQ